MAFTYDPTTERGKVRDLLWDIDEDSSDFTDAAIDGLLEQNSDDVWLAAADGCRALAAKFAKTGFSLKIPGAIELDKREQAKLLYNLASTYEKRATSSGTNIREFIDSYDINVGITGIDNSEYVGD
jgi:hypothetical protein